MTKLPSAGHLMTVVVSVAPNNPGAPAHGHSGPVYGYVLEGEMVFELEGDAPVIKRAGDTIWEPGGDRIHYQAANPGPSSRSSSRPKANDAATRNELVKSSNGVGQSS